MDLARRGVRLARAAIEEASRIGAVAVAFSPNGDVDTPEGAEAIPFLARAFEDDRLHLHLLRAGSA